MYKSDLDLDYNQYIIECNLRWPVEKPLPFPQWLASVASERIETDKIYRRQAD